MEVLDRFTPAQINHPMRITLLSFLLLAVVGVYAQVDKEAAISYNEGVLAFKEKNYEGAVIAYNKALMIDPTYTKARYNRAKARLRTKEFGKAIGDFNKVIEQDPKHKNALVYKAYAFMQLKKYPGAIATYNKVLQLDPAHTDAYSNRGIAFMREKKYDKAASDFKQLLESKPDNHAVRYNLAICQTKLKRTEDVIKTYGELIAGNYKPEVVYKERGRAYLGQKDYTKAIPDLQAAAELNPTNHELFYLIGMCQLKAGDIEPADNSFGAALALKADHEPSMKNKAYTSFKLKNYGAAVEDFSRLVEMDPKDITSRENRGLAYQQLENFKLAYIDFDAIVEVDPNRSTAFFNRANAAIGMEDFQKGCSDMREAAKLGYQKAFDHIAWVCDKAK